MDEEDLANLKSRDFICACGKNYLSYAALFTHIKQKHDGKAPGPIIRPRSERKRGRPRKNPLNDSEQRNSDSDNGDNANSNGKDLNNSLPHPERNIIQLGGTLGGAFQSYKVKQPLFSQSAFEQVQQPKKSLKKSISYEEKEKDFSPKYESSGEKSIQPPFEHTKSAPPSQLPISPAFEYSSLVVEHLKDIFQSYTDSQEEETHRQVFKLYTQTLYPIKNLESQKNKSNQYVKIKSSININSSNYHGNGKSKIQINSVVDGISRYLFEISQYLTPNQYSQLCFLLALFQDHISDRNGNPDDLEAIPFNEITKYTLSFLLHDLPKKMEIMNLHDLFVLQSRPATYLILNLCNWLSLKESANFDIPEAKMNMNMKINMNSQSNHNNHNKMSGKKNKEDDISNKDHSKVNTKNFSDNSKGSFLSHQNGFGGFDFSKKSSFTEFKSNLFSSFDAKKSPSREKQPLNDEYINSERSQPAERNPENSELQSQMKNEDEEENPNNEQKQMNTKKVQEQQQEQEQENENDNDSKNHPQNMQDEQPNNQFLQIPSNFIPEQ